MNITLDIAALIAAIAWPVVILIVLMASRKYLPDLAKGLAGRVKKIEILGVSLELAEAKPFTPDWIGTPGALDLRHQAAATQISDSTCQTFINQLSASDSADYAIVNLGSGTEWLTSRLYIMSIIFARRKGVRAFVFVEADERARKRFTGWARPESIRWSLARRYPWMEVAYAEAYSKVTMNIPPNPNAIVVSNRGQLGYSFDQDSAQPSINLLQGFLQRIQMDSVSPLDNWVIVEQSQNTNEHANWLNSEQLEDILGDDLQISAIRMSELKAMEPTKQFQAMGEFPGPFIALTRDDGRFQGLIERTVVLEQALEQFSRKTSE